MTIERDGAAITDPRRAKPDDRASQDMASDARSVGAGLHLQFHDCARQQSMARLDQGTASGHVDDPDTMSRSNGCRHDLVLFERLESWGAASIV
jgi:hypothetical protein